MASTGGKAGRRHGGKGKSISNDPELIMLARLVNEARYAEIEIVARRILNRLASQPLAMKALSFALLGLSRYDEAVALLDRATQQYPMDPELHNNRGIALSQLMRWDESLQSFERARSLTPNDPELLKNIGLALARMRRWQESLQSFQRARSLLPNDPELLKNIAMALTRLRRWGDAVPILLEAIEKHPGDYVEAISLLADCLFNTHRNDEAWTCYEELHRSDEGNLYLLFRLIATGLRRNHWDGMMDRIAELRKRSTELLNVSCVPLLSFMLPGLGPRDHRRIAESFAAIELNIEWPATKLSDIRTVDESSRRTLRIGYISGDFRPHPVGLMVPEIIERHDRTRFEVFGYATTTDDGSDIRKRLVNGFDKLTDVASLPISDLAERIRRDSVDILVDLSGWTEDSRPEALALRCAPLQVNWLGFPGTMGHAAIADYIIGDPVVTPEEDADCYTETIAQLPYCYLPADTTWLLGKAANRSAEGLPESGFVFCSLNGPQKYNPPLFDLWCRLLRETPGSVLWLSDHGAAGTDALRREAVKRGVQPERLVFARRVESKGDHQARIRLADLGLDPFPYNSHSTGIDLLWAGVPLLALRGDTFAGRVGASMLRAVGLDDLVAETQQQYLEIGLRLYHDRQELNLVRERLHEAKQSSPLFDMAGFTRNLEGIYTRMWEDYRRGKRIPILAVDTFRRQNSDMESGA